MSTQEIPNTKITLQETMRQIELETEAKVIQGYKTGDIQLPITAEGTLRSHVNDPQKQLYFLKNIMEEGAKKFEAAAGRQMSYSEMREMFG